MGECIRCRPGDKRYWVSKSNSSIAGRIGCEDQRCMANACSGIFGGCGKCSERGACCAKESEEDCGFHLSFGDGSGASGCLVQDEMSWGGVSFPVVLGGILKDSPDFERKQVDGILGMAYPSLACNPSCVTPPLEAMSAHLKMKNLFQLCVAEESGLLVLGEEDPSLIVEDIKWVPLHLASPPSYYTVSIAGNIKVGDKELPLSKLKKAIVDSGTTLIVLSKSSFKKLADHFKKNYCHVHGLCGSDSWFKPAHCANLPDDQRKQLPTIVIPLENNVNLELTPNEYMINYASKGKDFWCVGLMSLDSMSGGIDVILGNTVMKKYVTTFDREKHRIGFAKSRGDCVSRSMDALPPLPIEDSADTDKDPTKESENNKAKSGTLPTAGFCKIAQNCKECSGIQRCAWDAKDKRCVVGDDVFLMCFRDPAELFKHPFLITGVAIIAGILFLSIFVALVRRASGSRENNEDGEDLERPLAQDEDGFMDEAEKETTRSPTKNGNGVP